MISILNYPNFRIGLIGINRCFIRIHPNEVPMKSLLGTDKVRVIFKLNSRITFVVSSDGCRVVSMTLVFEFDLIQIFSYRIG
ncbi:hypothetical protein D3C72_2032890 [compost metagenome]